MSLYQYIYRVIVTNLFTLFYSITTLFVFAVNYLKNPLKSPWALKLRINPPTRLRDPKYGVHKYIKVNDNTKLHYVESGDPSKPLMIFLHGFPEFWYSWRYQILDFNKDYWCVAIDMRGYGDSERPEGVNSYRIELLIEDVRDLIRQLGSEKCILVSHDWGGLIACRFRDIYPELLSAVIMLGSTSREAWIHEIWNNYNQIIKSWYVFLFRMPVIPEKMLLMNDLAMYDSMLNVPGKNATDEEDIECYKYWFGKPFALTPPINFYRANYEYVLPEKVQKVEVPMLVVNGANDLYLSDTMLDIMKKEYSCIETSIIKNAGHFLQQEEPEEVNTRIRDFLNRHRAAVSS